MPSTTAPTEEGSGTEPKYPARDVTQGPFSFGSSGFYINYICRQGGTRLRRLLFSESLDNEEARQAAQHTVSIIDKSWIKAQLQHYGIHFSPDLDPFKTKALLLTSVAHGLCDAVPPQILKIRATLKEEYESRMEDYHDEMKAYRIQGLPRRIQKFEACTTPSEEAKCDASLFIRKYFLDDDGNPNRTKTPELILLPGYTDKGLALTGRTERVPGLHVADAGLGGAYDVTVIGWDRSRVNKKAHNIDMQQSLGHDGFSRLQHDWNRQMTRHHEHVEELRERAKIWNANAGSSFETDCITGRYIMRCETIQHDWPVLSNQLSLRFISSGRLAIFDLGIVVGLMVLGRTQEIVTKVLQDGEWNIDSAVANDTDDESESETESMDEDDSHDKRESEYNTGDEPDTPINLSSGKQIKHQRIENSHPRRLYFQWRGYNTMSGAIQFDPQNENTGYLDFADDDATAFDGDIHMDAMRGRISFQGYKVPGLAGPLTMNWNALSHLASERAKVPENHMW